MPLSSGYCVLWSKHTSHSALPIGPQPTACRWLSKLGFSSSNDCLYRSVAAAKVCLEGPPASPQRAHGSKRHNLPARPGFRGCPLGGRHFGILYDHSWPSADGWPVLLVLTQRDILTQRKIALGCAEWSGKRRIQSLKVLRREGYR